MSRILCNIIILEIQGAICPSFQLLRRAGGPWYGAWLLRNRYFCELRFAHQLQSWLKIKLLLSANTTMIIICILYLSIQNVFPMVLKEWRDSMFPHLYVCMLCTLQIQCQLVTYNVETQAIVQVIVLQIFFKKVTNTGVFKKCFKNRKQNNNKKM